MNNDKFFEQFKNIDGSGPDTDFPSMEKVWNRVEDKLDHKVLVRKNQIWKKLAIAASLLLIVSVAFHFLTRDTKQPEAENQIVVSDTPSNQEMQKDPVVATKKLSPEIKPEAGEILKRELSKPSDIVLKEPVGASIEYDKVEKDKRFIGVPAPQEERSTAAKALKFESADTQKSGEVEFVIDTRTGEAAIQKSEPLLVVDGKAVTKSTEKEMDHLQGEELTEVVVLKEPLYIINGIHYSETDLFGPEPTSPYAPLNKQEIETISILQGKEATDAYGQKGSKGVVIISTKNGRPAKPKGR